MNVMEKFKVYTYFFIISTLFVSWSQGRTPHTRLCGDNRCETIISIAKTAFNYNAGDKDMVSFRGNTLCRVMSKSVGDSSDLWEIEVQGRRGYAPKKMLTEQKILIKASDLIQVTSEKTLRENTDHIDNFQQNDLATENLHFGMSGNQGEEKSSSPDYTESKKDDIEQDQLKLVLAEEPIVVKVNMYKTGNNDGDKEPVEIKENEKNNEIMAENSPKFIEQFEINHSLNQSIRELFGAETDEESNKISSNENTYEDFHYAYQTKAEKSSDPTDHFGTKNNLHVCNDENDQNSISYNLVTFSNQDNFETKNSDNENFKAVLVEKSMPVEPDESKKISSELDENESVLTEVAEIVDSTPSILKEPSIVIIDKIESQGEVLLPEFDSIEKDRSKENRLQQASHNKEYLEPEIIEIPFLDTDQDRSLMEDENILLITSKSIIEDAYGDRTKEQQKDPMHEIRERTEEKVVSSDITMYVEEEYVDKGSAKQIEGNYWYERVKVSFQEIASLVQRSYEFYLNHYSNSKDEATVNIKRNFEDAYCEKNTKTCPEGIQQTIFSDHSKKSSNLKEKIDEKPFDELVHQIVAMADLIVLLLLVASAILIFIFGHYCLANHRRESALISKLNSLERKLFLSEKDCSVMKSELFDTRKKLNGIANKSFGADDLFRQCEEEKTQLREQIVSLEKELETAAEAGLELNKMVSELLNNQSGSDSIISSVEELQCQLNEQEATTIYINNLLAEKSRENSELKIEISETSKKFGAEIDELLELNRKLKSNKEMVETEMKSTIQALENEFTQNLEEKTEDIIRCKDEFTVLKKEFNDIMTKWHTSASEAEALRETLRNLNELGSERINSILEITDASAKLLTYKKENESLKECLNTEIETRKRLQEQIRDLNNDIACLRTESNQNEKEKLEAQTRLKVLSSYFKEKESQLQNELSAKEALFMKQKGDSTSTVERVGGLQEEIQGLRSQNDQLRAEIEAQSAAHKAQINAAEVRAHDSWLSAKQAERKLEETRYEASILRKKLTSLTHTKTSAERNIPYDGQILDMKASSPIHMESSGLSLLNLPPPPPLMGPLFNATNISPAIPFLPPPPLPLLKDMHTRPAPLGRLMSPPPPNHRYSGEEDRYSSYRYVPNERNDYPTDTETDFSPPRSPRPDTYQIERRYFSPTLPTKNKAIIESKNSGSDKSNILSSDEWDRQTF